MKIERISVLIPYRATPDRAPTAEWVFRRWEDSDFELCVGVDEGPAPFNRSRALNRARAQATGDFLAIMDADTIPPLLQLSETYARLQRYRWTTVFDAVAYLSPAGTQRMISKEKLPDGDSHALLPKDVMHVDPGGMGIMVMPAATWDSIGGFDERFQGWGWEDTAFRECLREGFGEEPSEKPHWTAYHLHHARAPIGKDSIRNEERFGRLYSRAAIRERLSAGLPATTDKD